MLTMPMDDETTTTTIASHAETRASETANTSSATRVGFSTVEIKEYPIIPGSNPAVSVGVPLSMDWTPLRDQADSYEIDFYEQTNPSQNRRSPLELRRLPSHRNHILLSMGFARSEITEATKKANIGRARRRRTQETMSLAPAQEACERFARVLKNATVGRSQKKLERNMLEACFRPIAVTNQTDSTTTSTSSTPMKAAAGESMDKTVVLALVKDDDTTSICTRSDRSLMSVA